MVGTDFVVAVVEGLCGLMVGAVGVGRDGAGSKDSVGLEGGGRSGSSPLPSSLGMSFNASNAFRNSSISDFVAP
jgi:hypothetical protein